MTTLWDTTGTAVVKALVAERRVSGAVASGLALTLVTVVDDRDVAIAEEAAAAAASMHPCRLLLVVRRDVTAPQPRLDAEVAIGGRLGPGEAVVMRMYGRLALHAESVVLPLLAPDAPVVTWWCGPPPELIAHDPLGVFADRRVSDCARADDPLAALRVRADDYAPGDTDLAWTRISGWRALLASALDGVTAQVRSGSVAAESGNASARLLAGWLASRLHVDFPVRDSAGPGITAVEIETTAGPIKVSRHDGRTATLQRLGQPERAMPLPRRELGDLMAEELRRLDADQPYADALSTATGITGLSDRSPVRTHIWRDPAEAAAGAASG